MTSDQALLHPAQEHGRAAKPLPSGDEWRDAADGDGQRQWHGAGHGQSGATWRTIHGESGASICYMGKPDVSI